MDKLIQLESQAYRAIQAIEHAQKILAQLNRQIAEETLRRKIQGECDGTDKQ